MDFHLTIDALSAAGLPAGEALSFLNSYEAALTGVPPVEAWQRVSRDVLSPNHPHAVHRLCWDDVFASWDDANGPRPAWIPTDAEVAGTHIARTCKRLWQPTYPHFFRWSVENREDFWRDTVEMLEIKFRTQPSRVLDVLNGVENARWFSGASLNIAESCFLAPGDTVAIVFQRERGSLFFGSRHTRMSEFVGGSGLSWTA